MVRIYERKYTNIRNGKAYAPYQNYLKENLDKAIDAVLEGTLKLSDAAKMYNVPKSTLSRKYRKLNCTQEKPGHPTLFSAAEENTFIRNMIILGNWGFPFDTTDLRVFAQKYLNKIGKQVHTLQDNMPGEDWARNFLERHKHEISNRTGSNISTDRARITPNVIDDFFFHYTKSVEGVTPDCIINYDETNLTDDPGNKKYIYKRGCKYPERVKNNSKTAISLMFAGTADGQSLPIYVVYKSDYLWDRWLEGGPNETRYNRSKSGWFDSVCFEDWFNTIIVPYARTKPGRKVLIGDNLSSHFCDNVLKTCEDLNIVFVCLPPKTTHLLQPLDVAFFAPLKSYWRKVLTNWKEREGRKHKTLIKSTFPALLGKLKEMLNEDNAESRNLIAGFDKSGLYPINPDRPKSRLPQLSLCEELVESTTSSVIVEMLQELRVPSEAPATNRRKKKCAVPPGKSITADDLCQPETTKQDKGKCKRKKVTITKKSRRLLPSTADLNYDSDVTVVMSESALLPSSAEPIAGPSGMCQNKTFCVHDSDTSDIDTVTTVALQNNESKEPPKPYVGKGKGIGKKSKVLEHPDIMESLVSDTTVAKYIKKKAMKRSDSTTSESESDLMSIHTDSDLIDCFADSSFEAHYDSDNLTLTQDADPDPKTLLNLSTKDNLVIENATDKTDGNQPTQGSLFYNDIEMDKTESKLPKTRNTENLENDQNFNNLHEDKEARDEESSEHCAGPSYCVGNFVLVRYYNRKKWCYYVGSVQTISLKENRDYTYTVEFLKTVKKPHLEFRKTRKVDRDEIQDINIMKKMYLKTTTNPNVLLLMDEDDKIYF